MLGHGRTPAILVLQDGTRYRGWQFGGRGIAVGEIVFNTSMTGYQEILTDPSYYRQMITMTTPHIGNYGVNGDDMESGKVYASGFIVRAPTRVASNWRSDESLEKWLEDQDVSASVVWIPVRLCVRFAVKVLCSV